MNITTVTINQKFHRLYEEGFYNQDLNKKWKNIKDTITETQKGTVGTVVRSANQKWMTREILTLMDERRICKNKNETEYNIVKNRIRTRIRKAKENWMPERCNEIEELARKYDLSYMMSL